jgi:hypothetical protein
MLDLTDDGSRAFGLVLLANTLPVAGLWLFGWSFTTLFVLYWLDLVTLLLVYGGCSLFAQRPIVTEGWDMRLAWVAEHGKDESWGDPSRAVHLSEHLPPVYVQNVRLLVPNLVAGLAFMLAAGGGVVSFTAGYPAGSLRWLSEIAAFPTTTLVGATMMVGSHCFDASRSYFGERRYEELSAHMVLEIPFRPILLLVVASVVGFIAAVLAALAVNAVVGETAAYWTLASLGVGGFLLVKLTIEWGRLRAERTDDPNGFAAWFTPEDPRDDHA